MSPDETPAPQGYRIEFTPRAVEMLAAIGDRREQTLLGVYSVNGNLGLPRSW